MQKATVQPPDGFDYYGGTIFWNNFEVVLAHLCKLISGDPTVWWPVHTQKRYGSKDTAFILNCGNGWVERDLFKQGLIKNCVSIDIMPKHIDEARAEAAVIGMPSTYILTDCNIFDPGNLSVDIAINVGAMHHVAYINKATEVLSRITRDGIYVAYDYTGPHRNQYSWKLWSKIIEVNHALPEKYRSRLRYPHLQTMLTSDPSEAIHSELQIEVLQRHFDLIEYAQLGGGIANAILYNNWVLYEERNTSEGKAALELILNADIDALNSGPEFNLYTFFVAKSKATGATSTSQRAKWQSEENEREQRAANNGGRYYPLSALEIIYNELGEIEHKLNLSLELNHGNLSASGALQPF